MTQGPGYYAVRRGRVPVIYYTWDHCQEQTNGFKGSRYKRFDSRQDAEEFLVGRDSWEPITSNIGAPQPPGTYPLKGSASTQPPSYTLSKAPLPLVVNQTSQVLLASFQQNPASALAMKRKQPQNNHSDDEVEIASVSTKKLKTSDPVIQVDNNEKASGSAEQKTRKKRKKPRKEKPSTSDVTSTTPNTASCDASIMNGSKSPDDPLKAFFARRNYANPIAFQRLSEVGFTVHEVRSMQGLDADVISKRFQTILGTKMAAMIESFAFVISTTSAAAWNELESNL